MRGGVIEELVEKGLFVKTWIPEDADEFDLKNQLIVEHEIIEHLTLYNEWSFSMFKSALLMICKINEILLEHGLILQDPHGANVGFIGTRPVYLDFGSIQPLKDSTHRALFWNSWVSVIQLYEHHIIDRDIFRLTLLFMDGLEPNDCACFKGFNGDTVVKIRNRLQYIRNCVDYRPLDSFSGKKKIVMKVLKTFINNSETELIRKEKKFYEKMYKKYNNDDRAFSTYWGGYENVYLDESNKIKGEDRVQYYIGKIRELDTKYHIEDIFDAAGNSGIFAQALLEETPIKHAVVMDLDEGAIEAGFKRVQRNELIKDNITFLLGNLIYNYESKVRYKTRENRLSCDCVIALAISHHILLTQGFRPDVFFKCIYDLCKKVAIIEFMPYGLWSGRKEDLNKVQVPEWYTLDWFVDEMSNYFRILQVENVVDNRIAIVGEKL